MAAPHRCVCILGDGAALGEGCGRGKGFADIVARVLEPHGVDVRNWSKQEQTATCCATEQLDEIQAQIREVSLMYGQAWVVIALGAHDRVFLLDMLEQAVEMLVSVCAQMDVRPIIMQVVPDDIDRRIAESTGAAFVPAPVSLVKQFNSDPACPFIPRPDSHKHMAKNLLSVLEEELHLPLAAPAREDSFENQPRQAPTDSLPRGSAAGRARSSGQASFDGIWMHKDNPNLIEMIQGNVIMSADGSSAPLHPTGQDTFYIEQGRQRVDAKVVGSELRWSDGDIWCLVEDEQPRIGRPPARAERKERKGDSKTLRKAFERAEEAHRRSQDVEHMSFELEEERERQVIERHRVAEERQRLEEGKMALNEETERISYYREQEANGGGGLFGWCKAR